MSGETSVQRRFAPGLLSWAALSLVGASAALIAATVLSGLESGYPDDRRLEYIAQRIATTWLALPVLAAAMLLAWIDTDSVDETAADTDTAAVPVTVPAIATVIARWLALVMSLLIVIAGIWTIWQFAVDVHFPKAAPSDSLAFLVEDAPWELRVAVTLSALGPMGIAVVAALFVRPRSDRALGEEPA